MANEITIAEFIHDVDWSAMPLGEVISWPQTLQKTVRIVLSSAVPTVLFWGEDRICFFNDAYLQRIDKDGGLTAFGRKAADAWFKKWDFTQPLIEKVFTEKTPLLFEDHPVRSQCDGELGERYWTVSLSPVFEDSEVGGVLLTCLDSTRHVQALHRANESEQRMFSIIESAPFPIGVYTGEEMRITVANKAIIDIWGKGPDVIGKSYREILPELGSQQIFEQLTEVYHTGRPFHAHNQRVDLVVDGTMCTFYFNYSFTPLFDRNGEVYGVMNTAADITDLNLLKQRAEQSEKNFRSIILQAPVAMCLMTGPRFVIEIANTSMLELWGRPSEKVVGKPIFEALPDIRDQGLEQMLQQAYSRGKTCTANERPVVLLRRGRYETVYQNFVYEPCRDAEGHIQGVLAITLDVTAQVTARKEVERLVNQKTAELLKSNLALKWSEERYHRMIDEVEDYAIILLDKDGIVQNWNKGAEKIKGYKEAEIVGKSFQNFYRKIDQEQGLPLKLINEAKAKGKASSEGWRVRKGGDQFWGSILITALHDADGNLIGFSKVTRDLTERKKAEDRLQEYSESLEFQNKELEQFAYAASHDMKEPLRKIHFFASYLNERLTGKLDEKLATYLKRIIGSAKKMTTLVENLLTYSQTTSTTDDVRPVDFNKLISDIASGLEEEQEAGTVSLEAEAIPPINGIPFQFDQLMQNLIHNAVKYKHPDRNLHVRITYDRVSAGEITGNGLKTARNYHKISVIDNGIGFQPAHSERIFDIFQRLHGSDKSGAGIGLAICKRIVQNHHGIICATGEPDVGARFDMYLPDATFSPKNPG